MEEARVLLERLAGAAAPYTFQTVPERQGAPPARVLHGGFGEVFPLLEEANRRGSGVYFVPNATDGRGRRAENIVAVRALFVDLDGAPLEALRGFLRPTALVETSPGRYHAYWRVEGVALEEFSRAQARLAERFGGDPAPKDLGRAMRLPGTLNWKRPAPFRARLLALGPAYTREEVEAAFPGLFAPPPAPPARAAFPQPSGGRRPGLLRWLGERMGSAPEGTRHTTLYRLARLAGGWAAAGVFAPEEALEVLVAGALSAGLPEAEAVRTARDGLERGLALPLEPPPPPKRESPLPVRPLRPPLV